MNSHAAVVSQDQRQPELEREIAGGLEKTAAYLVYQPVTSGRNGDIAFLEAFIRWSHPAWGPIRPAELLEIAERTGHSDEVTRFTIGTAVRELAVWRQTQPQLRISVNLTPAQLRSDSVVGIVSDALDQANVPPVALILEVTEEVLQDDPDRAITVVQSLRALGVRIALDDFGSGHLSLRTLQRLPVDILKVDDSVTARLGHDAEADRLVRSVVSLTETTGIVAVAEGVETIDQHHRLAKIGCPYQQGYLFARPLRQNEVARLLPGFRVLAELV